MLKGLAKGRGRQLFVAGLTALIVSVTSSASSTELPRSSDELVSYIRDAIESNNYEPFKQIINWRDVGKIKRRIVRYQIRHGLGRPIRSITFEDFPKNGLDGVLATGRLMVNMPITNRVRVIYEEPPVNSAGKRPTSVFLIGKIDNAYRIGLVVRKPGFDDDGD